MADAAARDRFTAEARVARRVAPFCAARILDAGVEAHVPYLVTEYIPGSTLIETVWREGPLTGPGLDAVAVGAATGLMAIHQTGLVHGSLGPDRVVLGPDGPCLTSFGITPPYGAATPAADLLAWANTVLFAALGRPPVGPQDLAALHEDLREVVAACLAPDPAARPVARAVLTRLLSGHDLSAGLLTEGARQAKLAARLPEIGPAHRPPAPARSRSGVVLWSVACAVCVLAIAAGAVFIFVRPHRGSSGQAGGATAGTSQAGATRLPTPLPSARAPATLTGNWSGQVHQTGPVLTVIVRISLPAGSATGTITYPQLSCSGRLAIVAVAKRKVTSGPDHRQRAGELPRRRHHAGLPARRDRCLHVPAGERHQPDRHPGPQRPDLGEAGRHRARVIPVRVQAREQAVQLAEQHRLGRDGQLRAGRAFPPARPAGPRPRWR